MNVRLNKQVVSKLEKVLEPVKEHLTAENLVNKWLNRDLDIFLNLAQDTAILTNNNNTLYT